MGLQLGSVCVHFSLGAPRQLPKVPTQKYPHSRDFLRHGMRGFIQKTWALRKGSPSQAHAPCCSRHRDPLSAPQQCMPFPKPKGDGETRGQVLHCKSCSCSQQRTGLICAMGAREVSDCRAVTAMLPELPAPRSLPFGLSSVSG